MQPRGIIGLALFLAGTSCAFSIAARETLADVPWQYLPESTLTASAALYSATFIPVAEHYLVFLDGVGDVQAEAYRTTGEGIAAAIEAIAETPPVAAVAEWYVDSSTRLDSRLSPR